MILLGVVSQTTVWSAEGRDRDGGGRDDERSRSEQHSDHGRNDRDRDDRDRDEERRGGDDGCGTGTATPRITWTRPATIVYGTPLSARQLNASADIPGNFVYNPVAGKVLAAGTHSLRVTFTPSDLRRYRVAQASVNLTVCKATPVLTWPSPVAITVGTALTGLQLNATANVPGTFCYQPGMGTVLSVGTHVLRVSFSPRDAGNYTTACASVCLTVSTVRKTTPLLAWTTPAPITFGTALSTTHLNATANVPGTFAYQPAAGTVLDAGTQTLSAVFTPTDGTRYNTASISVRLTVNPIAPVITWAVPAPITYGTALGVRELNARSVVAGSFAYVPAAGTVLSAGSQTLRTTFTPDNLRNYTTVTAQVVIQVRKAVPELTWAVPAPISYGTPLTALQLSARAAIPGIFIYDPPAGTILTAGTRTLRLAFTPDDQANWTGASATATLVVEQASPRLTWPQPEAILAGTPLSSAQLRATADVPGVFAYDPPVGAQLPVGMHPLQARFTPQDTLNFRVASITTTIQVVPNAVQTPVITWATPSPIVYGTPLSSQQLNATANVAGTFAYTPGTGTVLEVGDQILQVSFTPVDSTRYATASATVVLRVTKVVPVLAWPTSSPIIYDTALDGVQLAATSSMSGTFTYDPPAGTVLQAGRFNLSAVFTPADPVHVAGGVVTTELVVGPAVPLITWLAPAAITYGARLDNSQLTAASAVAGTFSYDPPAGTLLHAGTHVLRVTLSPTDTRNFTTATATVELVVDRAVPALEWPTPTPITYGEGVPAVAHAATASVPGTFTYVPTVGTQLTAGLQTLTAHFAPADSVNYEPASITASLTVLKATPQLVWAAPVDISYGTPLSATQLAATSIVPGRLTYSPSAGTVLPAGMRPLTVTLTPDDSANYTSASAHVTLHVRQALPVVTWTDPAAIVYGTPLSAVQLAATTTIPGVFTYSPTVETILPAGAQTLAVAFAPEDGANYEAASAQVRLLITQATPVLSWPVPAPIRYGTALTTSQLRATGSVPGSITYNPVIGTVLPAGMQRLQATLQPDDAANYVATTAAVDLRVDQAQPKITWEQPAPITYGTALGATQLTATADVPGVLTFDPPAGAMLSAGDHILRATFTPTDVRNYLTTTASVTLTVVKATPVLTWSVPLPIIYGTALGPQQLAATASVPGSFAYVPAAGQRLTAGDHVLSVTFTPEDVLNYTTASITVGQSVLQIQPTITWNAPVGVVYGTPLGDLQLNATADQPGALTYVPAIGTVLPVGTQELQVVFSPADQVNVAASTRTVSIQIARATPTIIWAQPAPIVFGTTLGGTQLNAVGSVPGTVSYSFPEGTVLNAGEHTLTATFTPADAANYTQATASVIQTVTRAPSTITWSDPAPIVYGTSIGETQLNAVGSVPGQMAYQPTAGPSLKSEPMTCLFFLRRRIQTTSCRPGRW